MYGKKRIVLSDRVVVLTDGGVGKRVYQKGSDGPYGSSHPLGFWYQRDGKFYADLKTPAQEYKALKFSELGTKGFGGTDTKAELRDAIKSHRKLKGTW